TRAPRLRRGLVVLAVTAGLGLSGCASPAVSAPAPTKATQPIAVFIGDSYTSGYGASIPTLAWASLVASGEGWKAVNRGRGGPAPRHPAYRGIHGRLLHLASGRLATAARGGEPRRGRRGLEGRQPRPRRHRLPDHERPERLRQGVLPQLSGDGGRGSQEPAGR